MTEPERKRGWWSRTFGDSESLEDALHQMADELTTARTMIEQISQERDVMRVAMTRRLDEQSTATARARAENEQLRRAAESQLGALRVQLETARQEHTKDRATAEQRQREAHLAERETARQTQALQRDLAAARAELSKARQALAQEEARGARGAESLASARAQNQELESEVADARTLLLELKSRHEDLLRKCDEAEKRAQTRHDRMQLAMELALGSVGAKLALKIAAQQSANDPIE